MYHVPNGLVQKYSEDILFQNFYSFFGENRSGESKRKVNVIKFREKK